MKYLIGTLIALWSTTNVLAQDDQRFKEVEYKTSDNITISASYQYPGNQQSSYPAIILIHQGGSSKKEWMDLPLTGKLLNEGYAVLAYDIRLHGDSGKDGEFSDLFNNPNRSPIDLLATMGFLTQDKRIDASRIGIIGASIGSNLACVASASDDFDVKSAVSLSAKTSAVQNLSGKKETIVPRNVFYIASKNEQAGKREFWAKELYDLTKGERKIKIAPGDKHGSYILRENQDLEDEIIQWFKKTL